MDSMRSLNTSLPRSSRRRSDPPPEKLIQTFKAAALSVTNLYKTAAAEQIRAREAGYQEALDALLTFLDKENLGLDDGEGWRVRQWATERLDGSPLSHGGNDSDDDRGEAEKEERISSPVAQPAENQDKTQLRHPSQPRSVAQDDSTPPISTEPQRDPLSSPEVFSFRSAHMYPQDTDMQTLDGSDNTPHQPESQSPTQLSSASPAVRLEVVPRASRTPHRNNRHNTRAAAGARSLGTGAGSKRAFRFGDYEFDLGGPGDGKDGTGGGGKRQRFT
ncbi:hypothetical protein ACLMJK_000482 [Lecanora helva]